MAEVTCGHCQRTFTNRTDALLEVKCPFCKRNVYTVQRQLDCVILTTVMSTTGKYECFLGEHFVHGRNCYDIGALNTSNGVVVRRHYLSKEEALAFWQEFATGMQAERNEQEEKDPLILLN